MREAIQKLHDAALVLVPLNGDLRNGRAQAKREKVGEAAARVAPISVPKLQRQEYATDPVMMTTHLRAGGLMGVRWDERGCVVLQVDEGDPTAVAAALDATLVAQHGSRLVYRADPTSRQKWHTDEGAGRFINIGPKTPDPIPDPVALADALPDIDLCDELDIDALAVSAPARTQAVLADRTPVSQRQELLDYYAKQGAVVAGIKPGGKNPITTRPREMGRAPWTEHRDGGYLAKGLAQYAEGTADLYLLPGTVPVNGVISACVDLDDVDHADADEARVVDAFGLPYARVVRKDNPGKRHLWYPAEVGLGCIKLYDGSRRFADLRTTRKNGGPGGGMRCYDGEAVAIRDAITAGVSGTPITTGALAPFRKAKSAESSAGAPSNQPTLGLGTIEDAIDWMSDQVATGEGRNDTLYRACCSLAASGMLATPDQRSQAIAALVPAQALLRPGEDRDVDAEVREQMERAVEFIADSGAAPPPAIKFAKDAVDLDDDLDDTSVLHLGESSFARLFAHQHVNDMRCVPLSDTRDEWRRWHKGRWMGKQNRVALRMMGDTVVAALEGDAKALAKFDKAGVFSNALKIATGLDNPSLVRPPDQWDTGQTLLGLPEGLVLDVATGEVRAQKMTDFITTSTGVMPADDAGEWPALVLELCSGDASQAAYVGVGAACSAVGTIGDHRILFCHGPPGSGKSTVVGGIQRALGGYAAKMQSEHLLAKRVSAHPTWLAALDGKRMVLASEVPKGKAWDAPLFSEMTGGEQMSARAIRKDEMNFQLRALFWVLGNNQPELPPAGEGDAGLRRRLKMVPFTEKPVEDVTIARHFHDSAEGRGQVLRWIIDQARECMGRDPNALYPRCDRVLDATALYLNQADPFDLWARRRLLHSRNGFVHTEDLLNAWNRTLQYDEASRTFGRRLKAWMSPTPRSQRGGKWGYAGYTFRNLEAV